ncbi:MAG: TolC family protein [Deltaproteobacteria bacterium]|nr:TolC family protein [Deltaproteobacteria bacterium]
MSCLVSVAVLAPPARAERLTLEAIQALADERSPRLSVVRAEVDLARAERVAASPSLPDNPVLEIAIGPRLSSEGTGLAVDASLLQSVFVDGQRGRRLAAADATVEVAEAAVVAARWALHADLHHAFDRAVVARERVALEREVEGFQRRLSEVAKKKLAAGEIATLDARLSDLELVEARQRTLAAEAEYRVACLQLGAISGWDRGGAPEPEGALASPPTVPLDALVAQALAREPERRVKLAAVELAKARLAAERSAGGVLPAFGVAFGHEGGAGPEPSVTTVQGVVSIPLPLSRSNQGGVARARAELAVAEADRDAHERLLVARLAELHSAHDAARERAAVLDADVVPRVGDNLALLERGYAVGEIELTETILARERFVRARLDALEALASALATRAELERLVGTDLEEVAR